SLEDSSQAVVGSVTQAHDGGVYVGSGGGLPRERSKNANSIGFEGGSTVQTVAVIPDLGTGTLDNPSVISVEKMSLNTIQSMEHRMTSAKATPVGVGKRAAEQRRKAESLKKEKVERLIAKRASVLEEIRETIPKFSW